ncbi:uncharacterized protein LOC132281012 [Cornus florida]|uniref:uncharacterized protein LOC132281012 n=1 Tax=Cornus florida TaxID=4283 RepID=UPI00289DF84D|nr:uncharacterized protein LOC132281012 [Cornus florida]
MEEYPSIPMERTGKIIRRAIYIFLQNYQYFTTTAALLAFPFSASILLSQALIPSSSLLSLLHSLLSSLFHAAGFPPSSQLFTILTVKLSQTTASSILALPFTLSSLIVAKASVIQALNHHKPSPPPSFSSFLSLYKPIIITQICNSILILAANAACFSLTVFAFNCLECLGFSSPNSILFVSATGAILYSVIIANAIIVCNLALVSSGMERCGGRVAILKACALIRGRTGTTLSLSVSVNMAMAAVEALFQYRVVGAYRHAKNPTSSMALEGIFIAYLNSIVIVLDTIVSCVFLRSCKTTCQIDEESKYYYQIEIQKQEANNLVKFKTSFC